MANISAIKLPNGTTYDLKDNISGYTTNTGTITKVQTTAGAHTAINVSSGAATFNVPTTAAHVGAIPTNTNGNTQNLLRPLQLNGLGDVTLDAKINTLRANRLAFLPADQIIIEKTTDGGSTWTDAGVADSTKVGLFSETRAGVSIPLLNGVKNINCGLRITITGMKYNVPSGTAETSKYNYWNSNYIVSTERYNQLKEMYFWVSANSDTISVKVERATGAASTTWNTIFNNSGYGMTGWSGNDYIRFSQGVFGGGTNQTGNYWNYRLTFFTRGPGGSTTLSGTNTTSAQSINEIRGYGDTWWTAGNEYAANDKIYTHDYLKNVTFPAKVTASGGFSGNLTGNVSGTAANVTGTVAIANGGTGQTTAANAINALLNGLPVWAADPTDTTYFVRQDTGGSASYGKVAFSTIWNYIGGKLPSWSKASTKPSYTFSEIGSKPTTISGYGITDAKIESGVITLGSNTITPLTSSSTLSAAKLSGAIPSAVTATTQTAGDNSTKIATTAFVSSAISSLPTAMQFIGTVGSNGTVTWANLATAAASNKGYTYKVITAHTAETGKPAAKAGDTIVSNGSEWIVIPSGDETATQSATTGISIANHATGTVIGVQSTTTTASKVTLGTAISVPNVTGSTDVTVPIRADSDVTVPKAASSATTVPIKNANATTVPTAASSATTVPIKNGSATSVPVVSSNNDATLSFAMDTTDTKKLKISWSATPTRTVFGTAASIYGVQSTTTSVTGVSGSTSIYGVQSTTTSVTGVSGSTTVRGVKTGDNSTTTASKVTLGTAKSIPNVTAATDVTVPIKNASSSTFVTGNTHSITDNGHTHTI